MISLEIDDEALRYFFFVVFPLSAASFVLMLVIFLGLAAGMVLEI